MMTIKHPRHWGAREHLFFLVCFLMVGYPSFYYGRRAFRVPSYEKGIELAETKGRKAASDEWETAAQRGDLSGFVGEAYDKAKDFPDESFRLAEYAAREATGLTLVQERSILLATICKHRTTA